MQPDSDSVPNKTTFKELLSGLSENGKYDHLRLFLSQHKTNEFGQYYLLVSRAVFGKVRLVDLEFQDNHIYVELQDCASGLFIHKSFDIDNPEFVFSLISWEDVSQMVLGETNSVSRGDNLLEFEF